MNNLQLNDDTISVSTLGLESEIQELRLKDIKELKQLSTKVRHLHTSVLYFRNVNKHKGIVCYNAWNSIVKIVGGAENGWNQLGQALGISSHDLDYISNYSYLARVDPVDIVLKVYTQNNDEATLDKVIKAIEGMNRLDMLKYLQEPITNIAQCFQLIDNDNGTININTFKNMNFDDLPPALNKSMVINNDSRKQQQIPTRVLESNSIGDRSEDPVLFLTFTEDGAETASKIKEYVQNWTEVMNVTVITLNDRKEEVFRNPERFIRECFESADLIVPIVTRDYLDEISIHNPSLPSTSDNLDSKYVGFIYNLIVNYYIHGTGCYNTKVRSVLPEGNDIQSLYGTISLYPDLLPWTHESDFNEQFKAFLNLDEIE